jgi:hypothetical protein
MRNLIPVFPTARQSLSQAEVLLLLKISGIYRGLFSFPSLITFLESQSASQEAATQVNTEPSGATLS